MYAKVSFVEDFGSDMVELLTKRFGNEIKAEQYGKCIDSPSDGYIGDLYLINDSGHYYTDRELYNKKVEENDYSWYRLLEPVDKYKVTVKDLVVHLSSWMKEFPQIKVSVQGIVHIGESDNYIKIMETLTNKISDVEKIMADFDKKIQFNQKCDVHVSNFALLNINHLAYTTDTCTEELQDKLNGGWRILAICPQPDQRRPDYILGRYNDDTVGLECCHL